MAGDLEPLQQYQQIVKPDGTPTEFFIRWAQTRQIDITEGITAAQAQQLIDDWAAARQIIAGSGLDGGGNLSADVTLTADVQEILDQLSTTHGAIIYRDSAAWAVLAPGTSGQVLQTNGAAADPSWATPSGGGGYGYEAAPATVPAIATYPTWFFQGSCTIADTSKGISFVNPGDASALVRGIYATAPSAPYDVYMRADSVMLDTTAVTSVISNSFGILLRDGTGGDALFARSNFERVAGDEQNLYNVDILRITNTGTVSAQVLARYSGERTRWLRVNVTSTTVTFYVSVDGLTWITVGTETIATFVGAITQIGIATRTTPAGASTSFIIQQFGTTAPT